MAAGMEAPAALSDQLSKSLGLTPAQASAGVGVVLAYAQNKLPASDFDKVASSVPGSQNYIQSAKDAGAVSPTLRSRTPMESTRRSANSASPPRWPANWCPKSPITSRAWPGPRSAGWSRVSSSNSTSSYHRGGETSVLPTPAAFCSPSIEARPLRPMEELLKEAAIAVALTVEASQPHRSVIPSVAPRISPRDLDRSRILVLPQKATCAPPLPTLKRWAGT
jgi:Protein of unknown function VcgC/VcgE (DUF2780).